MTSFKSDTLNILSERGFVYQCTDLEGLDKAFAVGPVTAYCGYDPTAPSMHIGNLITLMMLHWLQKTGHKPITLMGGATGMIGDPSFRSEDRPMMTEEIIAKNIEGLKKACGPVLNYGSGKTDALMVNNADWMKKVGYIEFLRDYGVHFSVNRMLSFDSVKTRIEREQHMSFLEFNYSLFQAYDFVELNKNYGCTVQLCGADQWANAISGVELGRKKANLNLFVLTAPLLLDGSGKKMGKSTGNVLWLNPEVQSDYEYYQYWRNSDDAMVGQLLRMFTTLPMDEVRKLEVLKDAEINEAKKILAFEATKMMRGADAATKAAETAQQTFGGSGRSEGLPKITAQESLSVVDLLVQAEFAASKGEARKLIQGNGVRINDVVVTDINQVLTAADFQTDNAAKLSAGKKRHILIERN